jgi:hypothetical protein
MVIRVIAVRADGARFGLPAAKRRKHPMDGYAVRAMKDGVFRDIAHRIA